jgi:hypothetical protein
MTCLPEPIATPQSDPVAVAAYDLDSLLYALHVSTTGFRAKGWEEDARRAESILSPNVAASEERLRQSLRGLRGITVRVQGRTYSSGPGRAEHVVKPVQVFLLAPAEGGGR